MSSSDKSLLKVLESGSEYLAERDVENPRLACELLATRLLGCKRLELYLNPGATLTDRQLEAMRRGIKRVSAHEPVQYVTGEAQFHNNVFKVDRRALIPRPETETMVDIVLKTQELWDRDKPVVADVGTGSGCIAITMALAHPDAFFVALDTSSEALSLARENAELLRATANIVFLEGELGDNVEPGSLDAVVANLPYIPTPEYEQLPSHIRDFEPRAALDGGPEGISRITATAQDAAIALKDSGMVFFEIGDSQKEPVSALLADLGFEKVEFKQDLAGKDRIASARMRATDRD